MPVADRNSSFHIHNFFYLKRLFYLRVHRTFHPRSKAIEGDKRLPVTVDVSEEGGAVQIKTDKLTAKVYDDFLIDFYKKDGTLLCADFRGERKKKKKLSDEALATLESEGHVVSALRP